MTDIIERIIRLHRYKIKRIKRALAAKGVKIEPQLLKNRIKQIKQNTWK